MNLLKNLRMWQKLALLAFIFIIPLVLAVHSSVSQQRKVGMDFVRQELRGIEYIRPLRTLLHDLQQHRGVAIALASGEESFRPRLDAARAQVDLDIKAVDEVDQRLRDDLGLGSAWTDYAASLNEELARPLPAPEEIFLGETKVIAELLDLMAKVSDASNLSRDANIESDYLLGVLVFQGPELAEQMGQARGLGSRAMSSKGMAAQAALDRLGQLAILVEYLGKRIEGSMSKAYAQNEALKDQFTAIDTELFNAVRDASMLVGTAGGGDGTEYFEAMTRNMEVVFRLMDQIDATLVQMLEQRAEGFERDLRAMAGLTLLGLLVALTISLFILRNITLPLRGIVSIASQIADGDLSVNVEPDRRRDELGELRTAFERMAAFLREMVFMAEQIAAGNLDVNIKPQSGHDVIGEALATMVHNLSELVGRVQKSGISVASSVNEIAATAKQQQATAAEIAATTMEIGATSREIAATSRELVKTVGEVSQVADQSAMAAGTGAAGLAQMEQTMRQLVDAAGAINSRLGVLNDKASNISQVITTITKVADQTNLLSLNAAIEAEKAGEYGRGFAVVATEIRRLADQTAVATYDIEQMVKEIQSAVSAGVMGMDKFSEEVRRAMLDIQQVGGLLSQIIQQVQALAPRFESVNEGMQAQATGAEQITQALTQLNEAAQQTVESLRQSSQAIDGLNDVSGELRGSVQRFRLQAS